MKKWHWCHHKYKLFFVLTWSMDVWFFIRLIVPPFRYCVKYFLYYYEKKCFSVIYISQKTISHILNFFSQQVRIMSQQTCSSPFCWYDVVFNDKQIIQIFRFCTAQDNYIKFKKEESLAEAAETVRLEQKCLRSSSLDYVYLMHVVQERKKFEFVEALLSFMHSWSNYYRFGHEKTEASAGYMNDLKSR